MSEHEHRKAQLASIAVALFSAAGYTEEPHIDAENRVISKENSKWVIVPRFYTTTRANLTLIVNSCRYAMMLADMVKADGSILVTTGIIAENYRRDILRQNFPVKILDQADLELAVINSNEPDLIKKWGALSREALSFSEAGAAEKLISRRYMELQSQGRTTPILDPRI